MATLQQPNDYQRRRRYLVLILILLLLSAAILLWALSAMHIIQEVWATLFNVLFAGIGTIIAFLQWHTQKQQENSNSPMLSLPDKVPYHEQFVQDLANKRKGAILVYASRKWRGTTLYLMPGLQETTGSLEAAANVVECWVSGRRQFRCRFPAVPPGHYTLLARSRQLRAQVTVRPGYLSEIDLR